MITRLVATTYADRNLLKKALQAPFEVRERPRAELAQPFGNLSSSRQARYICFLNPCARLDSARLSIAGWNSNPNHPCSVRISSVRDGGFRKPFTLRAGGATARSGAFRHGAGPAKAPIERTRGRETPKPRTTSELLKSSPRSTWNERETDTGVPYGVRLPFSAGRNP